MKFRARLSLFALEARENPSGPDLIDPIGGGEIPQDPTDPALTAPPAPAPEIPGDSTIDTSLGAVVGAINSTDPLQEYNTITNQPLIP